MAIEEKLDQEWINLLVQAKKMGITTEEIRTFLRQRSFTGDKHHENNKNS